MYILNIASAIKKDDNQSTTTYNLSLKTTIDELEFLKKTVIIQ